MIGIWRQPLEPAAFAGWAQLEGQVCLAERGQNADHRAAQGDERHVALVDEPETKTS